MTAHGENAERRGRRMTGREYWKSRLHRYGECIGRWTKLLTHRKERRESKRLAREAEVFAIDNLDDELEDA